MNESANFGILFTSELTEKLFEVSYYMELTPYEVIERTIETLFRTYQEQVIEGG